MTIVMNNNPKDKKSVRIAIISFVSAFLIVLASAIAIATGISAVIDSLLATNSIPGIDCRVCSRNCRSV